MPTSVPPFDWLSYSMLCSVVMDSMDLTSHLIARRASVASDTRAPSLPDLMTILMCPIHVTADVMRSTA